jgi:SAM-dependent methyltransferase
MIAPSGPCEICTQAKWSKDGLASRILALPDGYAVTTCGGCGQRRLEPQLSDSELKQLYSGAYFNSGGQPMSGGPGAAKTADDYASVVAPGRRTKFSTTIARLKSLNPQGRTLLDVGAATGEFVKLARAYGLQADGIELSEFAVRLASELHDLKLECLRLADVEKTGAYDFIHLNHVFEHFNDPVTELRHLHRLLAADGLLYIEVPYQFHAIEKLLFRFRGLEPQLSLHSLHHPFFYTPSTIAKLLAAHGFQIVSKSVFDPTRYEALTLRQKVKKALWRVLALGGIGNYIEMYARRSSK